MALHSTSSRSVERQFIMSVLRKLIKNDECDIFAKCLSIQNKCKGDGCGLISGAMIDMVFTQLVSKQNRPQVCQYHIGEADLLFSQTLKTRTKTIPLSFKKINGKGNLALNWSKNDKVKLSTTSRLSSSKSPSRLSSSAKSPSRLSSSKLPFSKLTPQNHILILNLREMQWWKNGPKHIQDGVPATLDFTINVKAGLYFIDKELCSRYVRLSSNNKTSALIRDQNVFYLMQLAIAQKSVIFLKPPKTIPRMMICFDYR